MFALLTDAGAVFGAADEERVDADRAALLALAERRRAAGRPATVIGWGGTEGVFGAVDPRVADALLDAALGARESVLVAAPVRVDAVRALGIPPLFADIVPAERVTPPVLPLAELDDDARAVAVLGVIRAQAAEVLGHGDSAAIGRDRPFHDVGFDSMTAVEFRNRLGAALGIKLPATAVFDHATPAALTEFILDRIAAGSGPLASLTELEAAVAAHRPDPARAAAISHRLRALLATLSPAAPDTRATRSEVDSEVASASVAELLDLIDNEVVGTPVDEETTSHG